MTGILHLSSDDQLDQEEFSARIRRRQYQGALIRSGASVLMWLVSIPAQQAGILSWAQFEGVTLSVVFLILMNPPLLQMGRGLVSRKSLEMWSLLINALEVTGYTAVVHFVGGLRAGFVTPIYCALIAYVGVVAPRRYPFIIATFSSIALTILVVLERSEILASYSVIPDLPPTRMSLAQTAIILATIIAGLHVVAFITGKAADLIKRGRRELAWRTAELEASIEEKLQVERDLRRSIEEKEVLIKEVHHRVKNNLQIVSSLLSLQSHYLEPGEGRLALKESQQRIRSMAQIHEMFYRSSDLQSLDLKSFLDNLTTSFSQAFASDDEFGISVEADPILVSLDTAIPVGLILHELVSNSVTHAKPDGGPGAISIVLKEQNGNVELTVHDNGAGFPPGMDWESTDSLGLKIVHSLTHQLGGNVRVADEEGTTFRIRFPLSPTPAASS